MSPIIAGLVGTGVMFLLLFLGMPIALALMLVGFLGLGYLASIEAALPVAASTLYHVAAHYPYTVIPLFIVMGGFASSGGLTT
ncbi:MAG: TRAP transporter large permease subunit, partial [Dehalococcoidia bacterium]|nr:TRAP transporter large permease subunit [Dehalococcoidia bacterium]